MNVIESLDRLKKLAQKDETIREMLLATKASKDPLEAFCLLSEQLGVPISLMDLVSAGEEAYAAMRRSTNGGGENSPLLAGEDDYYELFLADIG